MRRKMLIQLILPKKAQKAEVTSRKDSLTPATKTLNKPSSMKIVPQTVPVSNVQVNQQFFWTASLKTVN